jgi:selenide,water dikinase
LQGLPLVTDPNLIAGIENFEDAGVYRLRDDLALIQTMDFFTPIADDPYTFGQIAAANALSDVYAMGGKAVTAMNIICFPIGRLDISILREILRGGLDKIREAGVVLVGGHSVDDQELKYGLAVSGTIHPDRVLFNKGARPGDSLILTKPLGTGIVSTALKAGEADPLLVERSNRSMAFLNRRAAELMTEIPDVHACTDITGFGFLGHACEMADASGVGMVIRADKVPCFDGIRRLAEEGFLPGGLHRNRSFRASQVEIGPSVPVWLADVLFDPQTSGGLLISLPEKSARKLVEMLHAEDIVEAAVVGEIIPGPAGRIRVV